MMIISAPLWCAFSCIASFSIVGIVRAEDSVVSRQRDLERSAVAQRLEIQSIRLQLTKRIAARDKSTRAPLDARGTSSIVEKSDIYVDRESRRFDTTKPPIPSYGPDGKLMTPEKDKSHSEMRVVVTPDDYIYYEPETYEGYSGAAAVRTGPRSDATHLEASIFRIEMLGLLPIPSGLFHRTGVESFYDIEQRQKAKIESDSVDAIETIASTYHRPNGKRVTLWFAPELGNSVIQAEFASPKKDGIWRVQRVRSQMKRYENEVWFPREVEYTCHLGEELVQHELWTVENAEFKTAIDPTAFTMAGLSISPGTTVVGPSEGSKPSNPKVWSGEELKPMGTATPPSQPALPQRNPKILYFFFYR